MRGVMLLVAVTIWRGCDGLTPTSRRNILGAMVSSSAVLPKAANAVIQADRCDAGVGPGCSSESNPLIRDLLEKSAANKEKYDLENLSRYNYNNYKDYFAALSPPKYLVAHLTKGTFEVLTDGEIQAGMKEGRIKGGSAGNFQTNYKTRVDYYFVE